MAANYNYNDWNSSLMPYQTPVSSTQNTADANNNNSNMSFSYYDYRQQYYSQPQQPVYSLYANPLPPPLFAAPPPAQFAPPVPVMAPTRSHQLIDYLGLVQLTVLPLLKRKRRRQPDPTTMVPTTDYGMVLYPCKVCSKVFQKPYNLKLHMKTHSTDKPYKCAKCPKTFARSHDKKRHELLHDGVKNFKCEGYLQDGCTRWGCGKTFARLDALARHFRTETGWMCILPLMDEAKRHDPSDADLDNTAFIKRLIQEK